MMNKLLELQQTLPNSISLLRYGPKRECVAVSEVSPASVRSVSDLPQHLIMGKIAPSSFVKTAEGWSARWQGTEHDSFFNVTYNAKDNRWELSQYWHGLNGGMGIYQAGMPLDKVIGQAMYMEFPSNWDSHAKSLIEAEYQVTYLEHPKGAYNFCGIPDGAFRTIIFPIAVENLRTFREWIFEWLEKNKFEYPISAEAKILFQAINYLEGKAPDWTTNQVVAFKRSLDQTGLIPLGLPLRETANDGSSAWTLRREVYFLHLGIPFSGLTKFLDSVSSVNGPIRKRSDPALSFDVWPIIIPAGVEIQTKEVGLWDQGRTTRKLLCFSKNSDESKPATLEKMLANQLIADSDIQRAESISKDNVAEIEKVFAQAGLV